MTKKNGGQGAATKAGWWAWYVVIVVLVGLLVGCLASYGVWQFGVLVWSVYLTSAVLVAVFARPRRKKAKAKVRDEYEEYGEPW